MQPDLHWSKATQCYFPNHFEFKGTSKCPCFPSIFLCAEPSSGPSLRPGLAGAPGGRNHVERIWVQSLVHSLHSEHRLQGFDPSPSISFHPSDAPVSNHSSRGDGCRQRRDCLLVLHLVHKACRRICHCGEIDAEGEHHHWR